MTKDEALLLLERDLRRRGCTTSTLARLLPVSRRFLDTVDDLSSVTTRHVRHYLAGRRQQGLSARSQDSELRCLKTFFRVLVQERAFDRSPCDGLVVKCVKQPRTFVISEKNVGRLLEAALVIPPRTRYPRLHRAITLRNRAFLEVLYGTGVRATEAANLLVADLHLADGLLAVQSLKREKPRVLPLPPSSLTHLKLYLDEGRPKILGNVSDPGYLFLSKLNGRNFDGNASHQMVSKLAKRIGLKAYPHALRRSLATHLIQRKVSVLVVQQLLGHSRLSSTADYLSLDRADLHQVVALLEHDLA